MHPGFHDALERGADLFNRGLFFEAHEAWEEGWRREAGEPAYFLQGLIQVAAGFVKVQRRAPRGALALLDRGVERLSAFPPDAYGVALSALLDAVAPWRRAAAEAVAAGRPITAAIALPRVVLRRPASAGPTGGAEPSTRR